MDVNHLKFVKLLKYGDVQNSCQKYFHFVYLKNLNDIKFLVFKTRDRGEKMK